MGETSSGMTSSGAARHLPLKGKAEHTPPMPPGLYNMDCMEAMRQFPDKFFDLAVVDPPYGDAGMVNNSATKPWNRFGQRFDRYKVPEFARGVRDKVPDQPAQAAPGLRNTAKKSLRGTLPQGKTTSKSSSASHAIKSSGAETILICRRAGAS